MRAINLLFKEAGIISSFRKAMNEPFVSQRPRVSSYSSINRNASFSRGYGARRPQMTNSDDSFSIKRVLNGVRWGAIGMGLGGAAYLASE